MAARLKNMIVQHSGRTFRRYIYFASEHAFVVLDKAIYQVQRIAPGTWTTLPDSLEDTSTWMEQANALVYSEYQRAQMY